MMVFPKDHLTFSNTFITQEDIDNLVERYDNASFFERNAMNNEPFVRKLKEKGIIYDKTSQDNEEEKRIEEELKKSADSAAEALLKQADEATNNNSSHLDFLKSYNGKYPFKVDLDTYLETEEKVPGVDLLNNPLIKERIKNLIGVQYDHLVEIWNVCSPMEVENDVFTAEGCEQHNCDKTNAIIVVDISRNLFYVGIRTEGKAKIYSESNSEGRENEMGSQNAQSKLKEWSKE